MNIEPLEARIAPAAVLHYTDIDGDLVTVTVSKGTLAQLTAICHFSDADPAAPRTLQRINFDEGPLDGAGKSIFEGANLAVSVKRGPGITDGLANVGAIDASLVQGGITPVHLGAVSIAGDLGQIDAGDGDPTTTAVKSLTVRSIGRFGLSTQQTSLADLRSDISGALGALTVKGDFIDAYMLAVRIGNVTIGGSVIGGDAGGAGRISSYVGSIGAVKIGGNVIGGGGDNSGSIDAKTTMGSVSIGGSILGGDGVASGSVISIGRMGAAKVAHDVVGGAQTFCGVLRSSAGVASITVGGSLVGGDGLNSGHVGGGATGAIRIGHDLIGGAGIGSGSPSAVGLASVTVGGSLIGGTGEGSGSVSAGTSGITGAVKIGHDVRGGSISGAASSSGNGAITSNGRIGSVTIGGSLISGLDESTGALVLSGGIFAADDIGAVTIKGSVIGHENTGNGASLAVIAAGGQQVHGATTDIAIGKISISGRVERAQILAGYSSSTSGLVGVNADAQIGAVSVGGDWIASSIAAGAINLGNDDAVGGVGANGDNVNLGNAHDFKIVEATDDAAIVSRIASITIQGQLFGTPDLVLDRFGFVAEEIAAFKVGGLKIPLVPKEHNDGFIEIGPFNDVRIHEILTP